MDKLTDLSRMRHYIYAICEPKTHKIMYIGMSHHYPSRMKNHSNESLRGHSPKHIWLRKLKEQGLEPEIAILKLANGRKAALKAEKECIYRHQPPFNRDGRFKTTPNGKRKTNPRPAPLPYKCVFILESLNFNNHA